MQDENVSAQKFLVKRNRCPHFRNRKWTALFIDGLPRPIYVFNRTRKLKKRNRWSNCCNQFFLSTSTNRQVATMFIDNSQSQWINLKAVIFEISIEESDLEEERQPFANISEVSWNEDEAEILLSIGTVMRVESVELTNEITWIHLRTCTYDDSVREFFQIDRESLPSSIVDDETRSLLQLGWLFLNLFEFKKSEHFFSMIESSTHPVLVKLRRSLLTVCRIMRSLMNGSDSISDIPFALREFQKISQLMDDCELLHGMNRERWILTTQYVSTMLDILNSTDMGSSKESKLSELQKDFIEMWLKDEPELATSSTHSSANEPIPLLSEMTKLSNKQMKSAVYNILNLNEKNSKLEIRSSQSMTLLRMVLNAHQDGDYDRAIEAARSGLSIAEDYKDKIDFYELLAIA